MRKDGNNGRTKNIEQKFGGGVLTYWVKAAPEASLQAVEAEVASLKKSVSDGKTLVAGAITDKGITTATDAAFATMADNISQISTLAADTADATATAAQILAGAKAYVKGSPVVGTMPNNGGPSTAIAAGSLKAGYTSGGAIANLVAENIRNGINIGGVTGKYHPTIQQIYAGSFHPTGKRDVYSDQTIYQTWSTPMLSDFLCFGVQLNVSGNFSFQGIDTTGKASLYGVYNGSPFVSLVKYAPYNSEIRSGSDVEFMDWNDYSATLRHFEWYVQWYISNSTLYIKLGYRNGSDYSEMMDYSAVHVDSVYWVGIQY